MSCTTSKPLRMALTALLVEAAGVVGAALVYALYPFLANAKRLVEQRLFDVPPITLFCADGEFEVFARYRVPVLFCPKS